MVRMGFGNYLLCHILIWRPSDRFCVTVQCVQYLNGQRAGEYAGAVMGSRVGIDLFHSVRCSSGYVTTMPGAVAINQFGKKG
ncbi:Kynureninase [Trichinella spiralis]|uniref:Kynureninase n=2 Tax=Trichinella spiralis TaxID=6334 RepID=A0ABR3L308_TRISP|nr:hypothetical protein T01_13737 [Trichinella spiralis]